MDRPHYDRTMTSHRERRSATREERSARRGPGFWFGVGLLRRGFRIWRGDRTMVLLGLFPGVLAAAVVIAILAINLDPISEWMASFASSWPEALSQLVQIFVAIGLIWAVGLSLVYGFTGLTLLLGQPFFEAISRRVDDPLGLIPVAPERSRVTAFLGNVGERLVRLALAAAVSVGLFVLGLVPLAGTALAAILGLLFGGWFLALELTDYPFERRGHRLRYRRYALGHRRRVSLGFGTAAFVLFLIPGAAILTMSAAVAGGTLLTRHTLGESLETAPVGEPRPAA